MNVTIDDATEQQVTETIGRWKEKRAGTLRDGMDFEVRQIDNWLFGAEVVLWALGLDDLALAAGAAQTDSSA